MKEIIGVRFREGGKVYSFDPGSYDIKAGDAVIVETARGIELGYADGAPHTVDDSEVISPLRKVIRLATREDIKTSDELREREKKAVVVCQEKIGAHGLDMKVINAECSFDGSKIIFYFTADGRIDFRSLVKDLASVFRTRIELRQIGVRDEAKMLGGLGICGRPFCCCSFLDDFQPVSIKMAKEQNLSLNQAKISGTCGRLMCCLKYEQEAYEDLIRTTPRVGDIVETPSGVGTVADVSLISGNLRVKIGEDSEYTLKTFNKCDVCKKCCGKQKKQAKTSDGEEKQNSNTPDNPEPPKKQKNAPAKNAEA